MEELIIILRSDTDSTRYVIHDIRTYVNGSVIQLIQYNPGMSLELCENGAITETWGLGGDFGEFYYVLPAGGSELEKIYYIVCSYNADIDETSISNNIDAYTSERLTEEEYQSILDYYKEITIDSYEMNTENISLLRDGTLTAN